MNELVSVIIPVYNVEKYLERCVRSVIAQTYSNLQIILVDDGSPDSSGRICDQLAMEDERISVIHKANGGLSDARNRGVEQAEGKYITFIDSDDYVSPDYIEYLYILLKTNDADISCCCYIETTGDSVVYTVNDQFLDVQIMTGREACRRLYGKMRVVLTIACAKLYKSQLLKQYLFPVGRVHEDEATTFKFLYYSRCIAVGNRQLYAYYQRIDSIMGSVKKGVNKDAIWAMEHRGFYFEQLGETELAQLTWEYIFRYCLEGSMTNNGIYDKYLKKFKKGKKLSKETNFYLTLYNIHPVVYNIYACRGNLLNVLKTKVEIIFKKNKI